MACLEEKSSRIEWFPSRLPVSENAVLGVQRQRFFPFCTMETDPAGEEAPAGTMRMAVVRMSVVAFPETE